MTGVLDGYLIQPGKRDEEHNENQDDSRHLGSMAVLDGYLIVIEGEDIW